MFTIETPPTGLPFTTKSSLQALLKSRRAVSVSKRNDWLLAKDRVATPVSSSTEKDSESTAQQSSADAISSHETDLSNSDRNGDFSYSQKLFHIDDGNLYSIFSPLQGRSYGMKPSFLRKQKCTIQECHGRGRKILRKGLKFHNFLPSESVTSEKDNNYREDQWKVHSECKLREEHGTKQIMVSNWSQSVKHTRESSSDVDCHSPEVIPVGESVANSRESSPKFKTPREISSVCKLPIDSQCAFGNVETVTSESSNYVSANSKLSQNSVNYNSKFSFLNSLLQSVTESQSTNLCDPAPENSVQNSVPNTGQKRRRKPNQTRKVVPYTKYLSLMEETESSPLDLSLHPNDVAKNIQVSQICADQSVSLHTTAFKMNTRTPDCDNKINTTFEKHQIPVTHTFAKHEEHPDTVPPSYFSNSLNYLYPLPTNFPQPQVMPESKINSSEVNRSNQSIFKYNTSNTKKVTCHQDVNGVNQQTFVHRSSSTSKAKTHRKSQRSVIKQKLEDTFRQNGFLVKTKQVSDGDATFCKFRQLRKYTRYYLKSWQQHLPDEVHKMWKGFLPPKTVLPPVSASVQSSNKDLT